MVIDRVGDIKVEDHHYDGNHCIATEDPKPWRKQFNIYLAYASFYNPWTFVKTSANWKDPVWGMRVIYQIYGMAGVVKSLANGWGWLKGLWGSEIVKKTEVPRRRLELIPPHVSPARIAAAGQCQTA
jgi:hypothetical protein